MAASTLSDSASGRNASGLIASDKVEGTPVRRANGDRLGTIDRLVIDKRSGRVVYAVMSFGGFLGMGEDHYTIPWAKLRYDVDLDAYLADLTDEQIRGAPSGVRREAGGPQDPSFNPDWEEHVHKYFNAEPHPGEPIESASHEAQTKR